MRVQSLRSADHATLIGAAAAGTRAQISPSADNPIDRCVHDKLASLGLTPSARCTDEEFLRRVTLDVTGRLPEPERVRAFLADSDPNKRNAAIDRLLASPEYVDYWTLKWSDLLRNSNRSLGPKGLKAYHDWIRKCVEANMPWDRMIAEILTVEGSTVANGAGNYYRTGTDNLSRFFQTPEDLGESTAQITLGVRMQCARCHDHPFEKWTQTSITSWRLLQPRRRPTRKGRRREGSSPPTPGEIRHPRTGLVVAPRRWTGRRLPRASRATGARRSRTG